MWCMALRKNFSILNLVSVGRKIVYAHCMYNFQQHTVDSVKLQLRRPG